MTQTMAGAYQMEFGRIHKIKPDEKAFDRCPKCDGYGHQFDAAGNFAGLCPCRNRPRVESFVRGYRDSVRMGNPAWLERMDLATEYHETIYPLLAEWKEAHRKKKSVLILGPARSGKSSAAHLLAKKMIHKMMIPGFFVDCRDLALKIPRMVDDYTAKDFLETVNLWVEKRESILVVDQIGVEISRETARLRVREILERRFDLGASTLMVSPLSRSDLVKVYGEAFFDRVFGGDWAWIFDSGKEKKL